MLRKKCQETLETKPAPTSKCLDAPESEQVFGPESSTIILASQVVQLTIAIWRLPLRKDDLGSNSRRFSQGVDCRSSVNRIFRMHLFGSAHRAIRSPKSSSVAIASGELVYFPSTPFLQWIACYSIKSCCQRTSQRYFGRHIVRDSQYRNVYFCC